MAATRYTYHPDPATIIIDGTRCVGRRMVAPDRDWSPMVYTAAQCKKAPVAGSDLCETCRRHEANGSSADHWNGRITGPVPDDSHTTGSLWFTNKKPTWRGMVLPLVYGSSSRSIFVVGDHLYAQITHRGHTITVLSVTAPKPKATIAAPAPAPAPVEVPVLVVAAPAPAPAPVEDMEGFLTMVQGNMYWRNGSNLYEFDEATEKPGEYWGQFVDGDEPDIDMDAPEVVVDVSSSPADLEANPTHTARVAEFEATIAAQAARITELEAANATLVALRTALKALIA